MSPAFCPQVRRDFAEDLDVLEHDTDLLMLTQITGVWGPLLLALAGAITAIVQGNWPHLGITSVLTLWLATNAYTGWLR
jgi:hypothetical protein